jgi:hypothetical protein
MEFASFANPPPGIDKTFRSMGIAIIRTAALFIFLTCVAQAFCQPAIIVRSGIFNEQLSNDWKKALTSRMTSTKLGSFANLKRPLTSEELKWWKLIESKAGKWNTFRDSLKLPFGNIYIHDTVYVMTGFLGNDDGFTYGYQTVCLDVTALFRAYGAADLAVNDNRLDRVFSHEYTHVLHKEWLRQKGQPLRNFRDSILWECLYEGIGMYRSLSSRWLPANDTIPEATKQALGELTPILLERLRAIKSNPPLTNEQKEQLNAGLSRGNVSKKWGAFPVGIWLAMEAKGDDRKLRWWIGQGPEAVILLAKKYLNAKDL